MAGKDQSQPAVAEQKLVARWRINGPCWAWGPRWSAVARSPGRHPAQKPFLRACVVMERTIRVGPKALGCSGSRPGSITADFWRIQGLGRKSDDVKVAAKRSACSPSAPRGDQITAAL